MTQNITCYMLITIMIYLSQTFAPWIGQTLYVPPSDRTNTCEQWIKFSGFDETSPYINSHRAKTRNREHDKDVSIWAVIFAHLCTAFAKRVENVWYTPKRYCRDHGFGYPDYIQLPFVNYSNFEATCEEWLKFYDYKDGDTGFNIFYANKRVQTEDGVISLWVAVYGQVITEFGYNDPLQISKFCSIMVEKDKKMLFMSLDGTEKPCAEWIYLSGYTDDTAENVKIAKKGMKKIEKYKKFINYWTLWYVTYLLKSEKPRFLGLFASSSRNEDDILKTPLQFCIHQEYLDDNPVKYHNKP